MLLAQGAVWLVQESQQFDIQDTYLCCSSRGSMLICRPSGVRLGGNLMLGCLLAGCADCCSELPCPVASSFAAATALSGPRIMPLVTPIPSPQELPGHVPEDLIGRRVQLTSGLGLLVNREPPSICRFSSTAVLWRRRGLSSSASRDLRQKLANLNDIVLLYLSTPATVPD